MTEKQLRLHNLHKAKHFVCSFLRPVLLIARHLVLRAEILAPKLVNMKAAFVNVKMNIALLKVRSAGFPNLGFGVKSLDRLPSTVPDALGVFLRRNE